MPLARRLVARLKKLRTGRGFSGYCDDRLQKIREVNRGLHPDMYGTCDITFGAFLSVLALILDDVDLQELVENTPDDDIVSVIEEHPKYRVYYNKDGAHRYCDLLMQYLDDPLVRGWNIVRFLGGGVFGKALLIVSPEGVKRVIKISVEMPDSMYLTPKEEMQTQREFHKHGLAPAVFAYYRKKLHTGRIMSVIIMGAVQYTLQDMLCVVGRDARRLRTIAQMLVQAVTRMHNLNITHGDMHDQNVGFRVNIKTGRLQLLLIDFGQASLDIAFPQVDFEQMLRALVLNEYPHTYIFANAFATCMARFKADYVLHGTTAQFIHLKDYFDDEAYNLRLKNSKKVYTYTKRRYNFETNESTDDDNAITCKHVAKHVGL